MEFLITFMEGVISFISPCMLPLLPVYVSYFAGGSDKKKNTFLHALLFVLGFSLVFMSLGLFAGSLGSFVKGHQTVVGIVCGILLILFGIFYLSGANLPFFKGFKGFGDKPLNAFFSFLFGLIYALNLTPCVGTFLASALMMAGRSGSALKGMLLLFTYALGMGIPFLLSAMLLSQLRTVFGFIKKHYGVVNLLCGIFLILVGAHLVLTEIIH